MGYPSARAKLQKEGYARVWPDPAMTNLRLLLPEGCGGNEEQGYNRRDAVQSSHVHILV